MSRFPERAEPDLQKAGGVAPSQRGDAEEDPILGLDR
jgi:hypothetical protein